MIDLTSANKARNFIVNGHGGEVMDRGSSIPLPACRSEDFAPRKMFETWSSNLSNLVNFDSCQEPSTS